MKTDNMLMFTMLSGGEIKKIGGIIMHIAICDTDQMCVNAIEQHLKKYFSNSCIPLQIFSYCSGETLLQTDISFDIVFLAIDLQTENGIEIGKKLQQNHPQIILILVTENEHYLDHAFDIHAFRFFKKPISAVRLYTAMDAAITILDNNFITFYDTQKGNYAKVHVGDILYLEIENRKTKLVTTNSCYYTREKLSFWREKLTATYFATPHFSFIVNLNYLTEHERTQLFLEYNDQKIRIPISTKNQKQFAKTYHAFKRNTAVISYNKSSAI